MMLAEGMTEGRGLFVRFFELSMIPIKAIFDIV